MRHLRGLLSVITELQSRIAPSEPFRHQSFRDACPIFYQLSNALHPGAPSFCGCTASSSASCAGISFNRSLPFADQQLEFSTSSSSAHSSTSVPQALPLPNATSQSGYQVRELDWTKQGSPRSLQVTTSALSLTLRDRRFSAARLSILVDVPFLPGAAPLADITATDGTSLRPRTPTSAAPGARSIIPAIAAISSRPFSTAVSAEPPASGEAGAASGEGDEIKVELPEEEQKKKGGRRTKKNLFQVLRLMPNWGVGSKVAKRQWKEGNFYKVTRVEPRKNNSGNAWGIFHYHGIAATGKEEKIGGSGKKEWKEVVEVPPEETWKTA